MNKKEAQCSDVLSHICDQLDEELDSPRCREIKNHLKQCPNCVAYLDSLKTTVHLYAHYPIPRAPEGTRRKLFAVLKVKA